MKEFKKAEVIAKNAPTGSYAAGCPQFSAGAGGDYWTGSPGNPSNACKYCECTM